MNSDDVIRIPLFQTKPASVDQDKVQHRDLKRNDVIKLAESKGYSAKPCVAEDKVAVKIGKADDPNERIRYTVDGQILVVDEGFYWQVGTVDEWAKYLEEQQ